jgi:sodium-dependent dicarboxylate transporter 2/3/5
MNKHKRTLIVLSGVLIFILLGSLLQPLGFGREGAYAVATLVLMIYWWITKPIHIAATALLPIIINSLFSVAPMGTVLDDYFSSIVVLLLGANLLTISWKVWQLDKRIALFMLMVIGPSVRQQLIVWFLLSVVLSSVLPNAVVAAALCPIALAMIGYCSEKDLKIKSSNVKNWILLAIVWGAGLGGFGTPLGGAMNLVGISFIEELTGAEYLYSEWIIKMFPLLVVLSFASVLYLMFVKIDLKYIEGSREYFKDAYKNLSKMTSQEWILIGLFASSLVLAFTRPFYEAYLPDLKPPFVFLIAGFLSFLITDKNSKQILTWNYAVKHINWGLFILFSGGLAAGKLFVSTGASQTLASIIQNTNLTSLPLLLVVFIFAGMFFANTSSNTAATSILVPVSIGVVSGLPIEILPFIYVVTAACNAAFVLPTSIRAIPLSYGMDTDFMFKKGLAVAGISYIFLCIFSYYYILFL